jgi:hypothetical protein
MQGAMSRADRTVLWVAGSVLLLLTIAAAFSVPAGETEASRVPSSYASDTGGTRAAFLLLQSLGARATRWEEPPLRLVESTEPATLILAEPAIAPSHAERAALKRFIEQGGRVLFCGGRLAEFFPGLKLRKTSQDTLEFALLGRGELVRWANSAPLTNGELEKNGNLWRFLNSVGFEKSRVIYWDEYFHGERGSLWDYLGRIAAIRWAALPFGILLLAIFATYTRRRGPVIPAVSVSRLSPLEFVDSLANLYRKAKAASVPIYISARELRSQLVRKLAIPADSSDIDLAREASLRLGYKQDDLHKLLSEARDASAKRSVAAAEALRIVQEIQRCTADLMSAKPQHLK